MAPMGAAIRKATTPDKSITDFLAHIPFKADTTPVSSSGLPARTENVDS